MTDKIQSCAADLLGRSILISEQSSLVGGSWQERNAQGVPCAFDSPLIQFFLYNCNRVPRPFVLDIGANTGSFCLLPLLNPEIRVLAFEPNPEIYKLLKLNIELNGLADKVHTMPLALSREKGSASLKIPASGEQSGLSCLGRPKRFHEWTEARVPTNTLDNVLAQRKEEKLDFIKIDTEGCELFVLQGGKGALQKYAPAVLCEVNENNTAQFGYHPREVFNFFAAMGYTGVLLGVEDAFFFPSYKAE